MELSELEQLIKTRRSVRRWQNKPVPEELLTKAVELATWASSAGNSQNWRFYIVTGKKVKEIAGSMQAKSPMEKILKIPAGYDLIALIPVGYPDEQPVSRGRKPVNEVCEIVK